MKLPNQSAQHEISDCALRLVGPEPATDHAARLYPASEYLQHEWRRAVAVVRSTSRGWLLDKPAVRQERRHA